MSQGSGEKRLTKCPRCGGVHLIWLEITDAETTFSQTQLGIDPEGIHNYGLIRGVWGKCKKCLHKWKPRGVKMVTQLPGHPDYQPAARLAAKE